jgi:radical SAM-linked protein
MTFASGGPMRYVSHLDTMRTWERAIRRARLPLSYSQGFSPHARIAFAAPLPVGVEGERELMDLWLDEATAPAEVARRLTASTPPGLDVVAIEEVLEKQPSMQSILSHAEYRARLDTAHLDLEGGCSEIADRIAALLALAELDWEEQRGEKVRRYDLRRTILELALDLEDLDPPTLSMRLSLEQGRTGRPAQVLRALNLDAGVPLIARTTVWLRDPGDQTEDRTADQADGVEPSGATAEERA